MTLTESIAEAERQARGAVSRALMAYAGYQLAWAADPKAQPQDGSYAQKFTDALDTYAATCKLAGRCSALSGDEFVKWAPEMAAELARLSPKATQEMPEGEA